MIKPSHGHLAGMPTSVSYQTSTFSPRKKRGCDHTMLPPTASSGTQCPRSSHINHFTVSLPLSLREHIPSHVARNHIWSCVVKDLHYAYTAVYR